MDPDPFPSDEEPEEGDILVDKSSDLRQLAANIQNPGRRDPNDAGTFTLGRLHSRDTAGNERFMLPWY